VFGNENLTHILEDRNILQKLKAYGKNGVYGLSDIIKDIHCNTNRPENNTIIKPLEYGDGVYIMGAHNEWQFREFEDVRDTIINSISRYIAKYNEQKNTLGVKLTDRKEKQILKRFSYILLSINGEIPDDLTDELEINDENIEENADNMKAVYRKFDKTTKLALYDFTYGNFKKDKKGKYFKME
jgi:hypothetical protein